MCSETAYCPERATSRPVSGAVFIAWKRSIRLAAHVQRTCPICGTVCSNPALTSSESTYSVRQHHRSVMVRSILL